MSFNRSLLPSPLDYFQGQGLTLAGRGQWRTTACRFHGGSDSMRVNVASGGWCCMACDAKGGDVLAYHMNHHGIGFVDAAKELGAWVNDGRPVEQLKPAPLPARAALQVLAFEVTLAAVAAASLARGVPLTDADKERLLTAAARTNRLAEAYK
jgi:hypothetical protein